MAEMIICDFQSWINDKKVSIWFYWDTFTWNRITVLVKGQVDGENILMGRKWDTTQLAASVMHTGPV